MKNKLIICLQVFFMLLITSCGTLSLADLAGVHPVRDEFDPGLDKMTLGEILNSMWGKHGMPTYVMEGIDRDILVIDYYKASDKLVTRTVYHKGDFFDPASSESEQAVERDRSETYEFIFDKENQLLRWYKYYFYANGALQDDFQSGNQKYSYKNDKELRHIVGAEKEAMVNKARGLPVVKTQAAPVNPAQPGPAAHAHVSPLEKKLNELKSLRDKKVITEAEYAEMRKKALNEYK
jgi:hypothetical protein